MIVGIETQIDVTFWTSGYGGKPARMMITAIRRELHATKGWRVIARRKAYLPVDIDRKPTRTFKSFVRHKEREGLKTLSKADMEKARLRHAWYRRERAAAAIRALLPRENRLDVE